MAQKFVLTAQLQLQAPRNVQQVVSQMRSQLSGAATMDVKVNAPVRKIAQASKAMQNVTSATRDASRATGELSRTLGAAARRFGAITVATGTFLAVARGMKEGVKDAIEWERELVRISQVTGKTVKQLRGLSKEVRGLATDWGVSSKEILNAARVLSQAGFAADKVSKALKILAQTDLGATFGSIADTTEGAIAMLRQFGREAQDVGGDIKFLEQSLGAINAVSKAFAVEASDLITVIRRTGGVFEASGGKINELIALFTSVRGTTRETAETIATGFRTIFTRIQRTETIDQLKELGIILHDTTGKFVGPLEAIKRLSVGLSSLDPRDYRFNEIIEQLGGFRQIGKVIPLIKQYSMTTSALSVAQAGSASVAKDAEIAQQALATQITKVKEKFSELMASFTDTGTFRTMIGGALKLAEAFIKVAKALEPILPLLVSMMAMKLGRAMLPGLGSLAGAGRGRRGGGGAVRGFSQGGFVPGSGNRDTVPAMMTPGEFVIRKSSAKKMGADRLSSMNGYKSGGKAELSKGAKKRHKGQQKAMKAAGLPHADFTVEKEIGAFILKKGESKRGTKNSPYTGQDEDFTLLHRGLIKNVLKSAGSVKPEAAKGALRTGLPATLKSAKYGQYYPGGGGDAQKDVAAAVQNSTARGLKLAVKGAVNTVKKGDLLKLGPGMKPNMAAMASSIASMQEDEGLVGTIEGLVFEGLISSISGAAAGGSGANFDYPSDNIKNFKGKLGGLFGADLSGLFKAEAKRDQAKVKSKTQGIRKKVIADINDFGLDSSVRMKAGSASMANKSEQHRGRGAAALRGAASGGKIDSIPAMLTPGEYVINAKSASKIGYGSLSRMNQVGKYASGGIVGLAKGGSPGDAAAVRSTINVDASTLGTESVAASMKELGASTREIVQTLTEFNAYVDMGMEPLEALQTVLKDNNSALDLQEVAVLANADALEKSAKKSSRMVGEQQHKEADKLRGGVQAGRDEKEEAAMRQKMGERTEASQKLGKQAGAGKLKGKAGQRAEKEMQKALKMYEKALKRGATHVEALESAEKGLEQAIKERQKAEKDRAQKVAAAAMDKRAGEMAGLKKGQSEIEGVQKQAQVAQNMIFLAGAASALTANLGILSDESAAAASEAIGFGASVAGMVGTFSDMAANAMLASNAKKQEAIAGTQAAAADTAEAGASGTAAGAEAVEVTASGASATADFEEAVASKMAAAKGGAGGKAMKGMMGVGMGFAAGGAVASFISAKTQQKADKAGAGAQDIIKGIGETGGGDLDDLKALQMEQIGLEKKSQDQMTGGMGGALAGAAAGAAIGSFIPIVGTVVGGIIGGILGGFGGAAAGGALSEADQRAFDASNAAADASYTAAKATYNFSKAMDQIAKAGLTTAEALTRTTTAATKLSGERSKAEASLKKAQEKQAEMKAEGAGSKEMKAVDEQVETAESQVGNVRKASAQAEAALRGGIDKMMQEAIAGGKSFRQAVSGPEVRGAVAAYRQALIDNGKTATEVNEIMAGMAKGFKEFDKQQQRMRAIAAANERVRLMEKQMILQTAAALAKLSGAALGLKKFNEALVSTANAVKGVFSAVGPQLSREIGDISNVADFGKFNAAVDRAAALLGPAGRQMADRVKATASSISNLRKNLTMAKLPGLGSTRSDADISSMLSSGGVNMSAMPAAMQKELIDRIKSMGDKIEEADLDKIIEDMVNSANKQVDVLKKAADLQDQYVTAYDKSAKELIAMKNSEIAMTQKYLDIRERGFDRLAKAQGVTRTRGSKERGRLQNAQVGLAGTGARAGDVKGVAARARQARAAVVWANEQNKAGQATARSTAIGNTAADVMQRTTKELERLSDQSAKAADVMGKLEEVQGERQSRQDALQGTMKEFAFSNNEGRRTMSRNFMALNKVLSTGTLASVPEEMRSAVGGLLDKFKDVELMPGFTGGDISKQLQVQELDAAIRAAGGQGVTPEMMEQIFEGVTTEEEKLMQELRNINHEELAAQKEIASINKEGNDYMRQGITKGLTAIVTAINNLRLGGPIGGGMVGGGAAPAPPPGGFGAPGISQGGIVYKAGGGSIFQPKGTDTVPAMLTPGEFVVKRSSAKKIGMGTLQALNSGNAGAVGHGLGGMVDYFAGGGAVNIMEGSKFKDQFITRIAWLAKRNPRGLGKAMRHDPGGGMAGWLGMDPKEVAKFIGIMKDPAIDFKTATDVMGQANWGRRFGQLNFGSRLLDVLNDNSWMFSKAGAMSVRVSDDAGPQAPGDVGKAGELYKWIQTNLLSGVSPIKAFGDATNDTNDLMSFVMPPFDPMVYMLMKGLLTPGREQRFDEGDEQRKENEKRMTPKQRQLKKKRDRLRSRLRNLRGGLFAQGGHASDTVPAMLTPGEFVMSAGAVDRHGLGFMNSVNKGTIPGFAGGGPVYRQGGGPSGPTEAYLSNAPADNTGALIGTLTKMSNRAEASSMKLIAGQTTMVVSQGVTNMTLTSLNTNLQAGFNSLRGRQQALADNIDIASGLSQDVINERRRFGFAAGGAVPGAGNSDSVSAMLTPGEFVMNKKAVSQYGGGVMRAMNNGGLVSYLQDGGKGKRPADNLEWLLPTRDAVRGMRTTVNDETHKKIMEYGNDVGWWKASVGRNSQMDQMTRGYIEVWEGIKAEEMGTGMKKPGPSAPYAKIIDYYNKNSWDSTTAAHVKRIDAHSKEQMKQGGVETKPGSPLAKGAGAGLERIFGPIGSGIKGIKDGLIGGTMKGLGWATGNSEYSAWGDAHLKGFGADMKDFLTYRHAPGSEKGAKKSRDELNAFFRDEVGGKLGTAGQITNKGPQELLEFLIPGFGVNKVRKLVKAYKGFKAGKAADKLHQAFQTLDRANLLLNKRNEGPEAVKMNEQEVMRQNLLGNVPIMESGLDTLQRLELADDMIDIEMFDFGGAKGPKGAKPPTGATGSAPLLSRMGDIASTTMSQRGDQRNAAVEAARALISNGVTGAMDTGRWLTQTGGEIFGAGKATWEEYRAMRAEQIAIAVANRARLARNTEILNNLPYDERQKWTLNPTTGEPVLSLAWEKMKAGKNVPADPDPAFGPPVEEHQKFDFTAGDWAWAEALRYPTAQSVGGLRVDHPGLDDAIHNYVTERLFLDPKGPGGPFTRPKDLLPNDDRFTNVMDLMGRGATPESLRAAFPIIPLDPTQPDIDMGRMTWRALSTRAMTKRQHAGKPGVPAYSPTAELKQQLNRWIQNIYTKPLATGFRTGGLRAGFFGGLGKERITTGFDKNGMAYDPWTNLTEAGRFEHGAMMNAVHMLKDKDFRAEWGQKEWKAIMEMRKRGGGTDFKGNVVGRTGTGGGKYGTGRRDPRKKYGSLGQSLGQSRGVTGAPGESQGHVYASGGPVIPYDGWFDGLGLRPFEKEAIKKMLPAGFKGHDSGLPNADKLEGMSPFGMFTLPQDIMGRATLQADANINKITNGWMYSTKGRMGKMSMATLTKAGEKTLPFDKDVERDRRKQFQDDPISRSTDEIRKEELRQRIAEANPLLGKMAGKTLPGYRVGDIYDIDTTRPALASVVPGLAGARTDGYKRLGILHKDYHLPGFSGSQAAEAGGRIGYWPKAAQMQLGNMMFAGDYNPWNPIKSKKTNFLRLQGYGTRGNIPIEDLQSKLYEMIKSKKPSADRLWRQMLEEKNGLIAQGKPSAYFAAGGAARGTDTVPAMLTPGEFVMNNDAVKKYGVGFMDKVNKGALPGFKLGGPVSYLQNGGQGEGQASWPDFGKLSEALNSIGETFSDVFTAFDRFNSTFAGFISVLDNMKMTHNHKGDMSIFVHGIPNADKIAGMIKDAVFNDIENHVELAFAKNRDNFNATG